MHLKKKCVEYFAENWNLESEALAFYTYILSDIQRHPSLEKTAMVPASSGIQ